MWYMVSCGLAREPHFCQNIMLAGWIPVLTAQTAGDLVLTARNILSAAFIHSSGWPTNLIPDQVYSRPNSLDSPPRLPGSDALDYLPPKHRSHSSTMTLRLKNGASFRTGNMSKTFVTAIYKRLTTV